MLGFRRIAVLGAASGRRAASAAPAATAPARSSVTGGVTVANLQQLEARWPALSDADRRAARDAVKQLMRGDWKALTAEQKHAAYFVAYGPTVPKPSDTYVVAGSVAAAIAAGVGIFVLSRSVAPPAQRTETREWQEATNAKMRAQKANPLKGISSEGYKGKGWVTAA